MTQSQVERTFEALYTLEDLRELWRRTAPFHQLTSEQKSKADMLIQKARKALDQIERAL